jgi:hypothetical protein
LKSHRGDRCVADTNQFYTELGTNIDDLWWQFTSGAAETDGLARNLRSEHFELGTSEEYRFAERITNGAVIMLASLISGLAVVAT